MTYEELRASALLSESADSCGAMAVFPMTPSLHHWLTVTTRTGEALELASKGKGDTTLVPRGLVSDWDEDRRVVGQQLSLKSAVVPRENPVDQRPILKACKAFLDAGKSGQLEAGTGTGKTVMACDLIAHVNRKTLVIVPKEDLMNQWVKELSANLPGVKIGRIRQNKYDVKGKDVVVAMLHSLAKPEKYPQEMRREFGLVIWDECHRVPAETFQVTAGYFAAKLRLGLSATPERWDGKEILFQAHIGPVRARSRAVLMKPLVGMYKSPWRCPRIHRNGAVIRIPHKAGKCGHIVNMLVEDEQRNAIIMRRILAAHKNSRRTVVFSDRIAHLRLMENVAQKAGVPKGDTALYISGQKKGALEAAKVKPLIFATYGMMAEGTDIPWLDCTALTTPRSNVKQPVGRILREYPDKPRPVVLDFVDFDSPVFARYAENRDFYYKEIGADVTRYG